MSPLRPTSTSPSHTAISPLGLMLCALATLVAVPVLLSSGAGTEDLEVAAVAVPSTESEIDVDAEIEIDGLFAAGARVEEVPDAAVPEPDPQAAADVVAVAGDVSTTGLAAAIIADPIEALPQSTPTETTSPPATAPPETAPPETAPPETAPPETTPPETTPPTTAAETTEVTAEPESPGAPTAEQWAALRHCESSGSYTVISSNGLYHGAYQFYQPTWDGLANVAGRPDLVGVPPSQAAPADQDALALLLWQRRGSAPWPHCGRYLPSGP